MRLLLTHLCPAIFEPNLFRKEEEKNAKKKLNHQVLIRGNAFAAKVNRCNVFLTQSNLLSLHYIGFRQLDY